MDKCKIGILEFLGSETWWLSWTRSSGLYTYEISAIYTQICGIQLAWIYYWHPESIRAQGPNVSITPQLVLEFHIESFVHNH